MQARYANLFTECCTYIVEGICFHLLTVRPHPQVYKSIFKMWIFILVWASCSHANRILGHKNWDFFDACQNIDLQKLVMSQLSLHILIVLINITLWERKCVNACCGQRLTLFAHTVLFFCIHCQTSISLNVFSAQMVFTTQENRNRQWTDMDESRCD